MNATGKVKVLVVEDSPVVQRLLEHVINGDPRLEVVGVAKDAVDAMALIRERAPDILTMDIRLPRMNGFEATRWIMREAPLPIVVVASNVDDKALDISMNALRAGALTVVAKPAGTGREDYEAMARQLCTQLVIMSQIKVVRQRHFGSTHPPALAASLAPRTIELAAIVASTGGPGALARILGALPKDFPAPIAVVQHIGAPFVAGFAHWLNSVSVLPVKLAEDRERMAPGVVFVAPGEAHLSVVNGSFRLECGAAVQGQLPSGDVLFASIATAYRDRALGILLTGMGEDGARGLALMRSAGAHTIAESRATALIWGMPGAAVGMGAAVEQLPIGAIAQRMQELAGRKPAEAAP